MQAGKACMECHNRVAGITHRNICPGCGLEAPKSTSGIPPANERANILWDFQLQTDKLVMSDRQDIVEESTGGGQSNPKLEKCQGSKEEIKKKVE